jgi:hypothetical protein
MGIHMLPWPSFLLVLLLSSCGFAYKPMIAQTNKNTIVYTIPLESHTLDISMGVDKRTRDSVEFGVLLKIAATHPGHNISLDTLRLYLTGDRPDARLNYYKQVNGTYYYGYRFIHLTKKDIHRRMLVHMEADITEDGRSTTIKQSLNFKRFFWFDIAGN